MNAELTTPAPARRRGRVAKAIFGMVATVVLVAGVSTPAYASGFGTTPLNTFTISVGGVNITVPDGCFLSMMVHGSDKKVKSLVAGVECIGPAAIIPGLFCNSYAKFRYVDVKGKTYKTATTKVNNKCLQAEIPITTPKAIAPYTAKYGNLCVDVYAGGKKKATTCVAISKG